MLRTGRDTGAAPNGLWELSVRRWQAAELYGRTRADAISKAERAAARVVHEVWQHDTVGGWVAVWLADTASGLKLATARKYGADTRDNVVPHLGHIRLAEVTRGPIIETRGVNSYRH